MHPISSNKQNENFRPPLSSSVRNAQGTPPLDSETGELESSGQILISFNGKKNKTIVFLIQEEKNPNFHIF